MHPSVYSSTIYNSQDIEAIQMPIDRRMDKEDVVCVYNGQLVIKKNEILPFVATWMDLENIMLSEINQTKKNKYYMILLIYGM